MTIASRVAVAALLGLLLGADAVGQARKVQVGYCSTLKNIDAATAAGFDYVELGTTEIAALSDEEYEKAVIRIKPAACWPPVAMASESLHREPSFGWPDLQPTSPRRTQVVNLSI